MLLDHNRILQTDDPDRLSTFLEAKGMALGAIGRAGEGPVAPLCRIDAVYGADTYLAYASYGAPVDIEIPAFSAGYSLTLPLHGVTAIQSGRTFVGCRGRQGGLTSPARDACLSMSAGAARLTLNLSRNLVEGMFERLSGQHVHGAITFEIGFDLGNPAGRMVQNAVEMLVRDIRTGINPMANAARQAHFEALVVGEILLHHPHSHRALLDRTATGAISRDLRRVMDHIEAHLDAPMTLADLVEVAGVPARTLNEHFRAMTGFPPMTYLLRRRLQEARCLLMRDPEQGVTRAALACGFSHLGRFSMAYRRMFGESPSETKRARRGGG